MRLATTVLAALTLGALAAPTLAQEGAAPGATRGQVVPVRSATFSTQYLRMPAQAEGLLYAPTAPGPNAKVALLFIHPNRNNFNASTGREMANRGYRVLMVNYRGDDEHREADPEAYLPAISDGIRYLRTLPSVQKVVIIGHSGGGHLVPLYQNVAEHGPAACSGPEKIRPCPTEGLTGLEKADGMVLLDATLGAFHTMSSVDPAADGDRRIAALDMFSAANGYDAQGRRAQYSPEFAKRFYAAQSARNDKIIDDVVARLKAIEQGRSAYTDDEPLVIRGVGVQASGARLYQPDPAFAAHTKRPHLLIKADGTQAQAVLTSVRPPVGERVGQALRSLELMTQNTTVRKFLANNAIRTRADYAITADDITGVDWTSSYNSTPANVEGVTVPSLVLSMTCHYLLVPGEIMFDHLAAKDKTYAAVEGATHGFSPCKPEYGDTNKRTFDYMDAWLSKPGRF